MAHGKADSRIILSGYDVGPTSKGIGRDFGDAASELSREVSYPYHSFGLEATVAPGDLTKEQLQIAELMCGLNFLNTPIGGVLEELGVDDYTFMRTTSARTEPKPLGRGLLVVKDTLEAVRREPQESDLRTGGTIYNFGALALVGAAGVKRSILYPQGLPKSRRVPRSIGYHMGNPAVSTAVEQALNLIEEIYGHVR